MTVKSVKAVAIQGEPRKGEVWRKWNAHTSHICSVQNYCADLHLATPTPTATFWLIVAEAGQFEYVQVRGLAGKPGSIRTDTDNFIPIHQFTDCERPCGYHRYAADLGEYKLLRRAGMTREEAGVGK